MGHMYRQGMLGLCDLLLLVVFSGWYDSLTTCADVRAFSNRAGVQWAKRVLHPCGACSVPVKPAHTVLATSGWMMAASRNHTHSSYRYPAAMMCTLVAFAI